MKFRLCRAITVQGDFVANVFCSIFEKFTLSDAKADSILVDDDVDTFQVD